MREPTLGTFPHPFVCIACRYCQRRGRYRRDRLIREHGADITLDDFVRLVSANCRRAEDRVAARDAMGLMLCARLCALKPVLNANRACAPSANTVVDSRQSIIESL